ncbi:hypothetical protein [Pontibacillus litoralis]|uniref:Uncharacterized protein n=1 Tax=Pontibacillus litoralis JSM 072002 TaxID=1385512 RepID=A0A0A5GDM6_9BACI|nr:hypothetical protein [Pontibacillus litoralis]KGX89225.1 hypothetical protein N784_02345 [Pontibacillus litoralis JSM 072002]
MKKVIDGAVYNTATAKKICEQRTEEFQNEKGADVKQLKQLFKTKSGKYFFFIHNTFISYACVNGDDLNPKFEEMELEEKKIIPVDYGLAFQFASEVQASGEQQKIIGKYFPELVNFETFEHQKIQKKIYLSEKANWYLEMMLTETEDTNSSLIEMLIVQQYQRLYSEGIMLRDPYFEMED